MSDTSKGAIAVVDPKSGDVMMRFIARELRMRDGSVRAIKSGAAMVGLREEAGEIAVWGSGDNVQAMVTSEGYRSANVICQITVRTPPFVEIPGVGRVPNPYVLTDESGAFKAGYFRKVAMAPGLTGNPVLVDRCTYLDLHSYLMEDLLNLRTRSPHAVMAGLRDVPVANRLRRAMERHNEDLQERIDEYESKGTRKSYLRKQLVTESQIEAAIEAAEDGLWRFMELEPATGYGIWINAVAEPVAKVFRTYSQTKKFGTRRLEAIAYRNVMRDHPLAPRMKVEPSMLRGPDKQRVAMVRCFFHEFMQDEREIDQMIAQFSEGARLTGLAVDSQIIPERVGTSDARADAVAEAPEGVNEKPAETVVVEGEAAEVVNADPGEPPSERDALYAQIIDGEKLLGDNATAALRKKHPAMKLPLTAEIDDLRKYKKAIDAALDEGA